MVLAALVLAAVLHLGAAMLVFAGTVLFLGAPPGPGHDRLLRRLAGLNLAAALGWFLAEAAVVNDGWSGVLAPPLLGAVLTETRFGRVWGPHLALAAGLWLWLRFSRTPRPGAPEGGAAALLAGANLGTIGLVGHAVLPGGWPGGLNQAASVLHLLAGGYWAGALPFVLALIGRPDRAALLVRFSRLGHAAVAAVLLSGAAKTLLIQTARPALDPGPGWSALLAAKILAALAMVALALRNRYRLVPRGPAGAAALRRGTLAEIALSALVLALASLAATLSPFGHD